MADLQEYQRKTPIQPASTESGMQQGLESFAQTIQPKRNPLVEVVGELGGRIAQSAANERARLAGIEAGKTPGRTILPPIGESDAEFVKAYKNEEARNLTYNGNKLLSDLYQTANKRPNGQSLNEFQKNSLNGIQDILKQSSEDIRPELERQLMSAYEHNYNQLSNHVYQENQRYLQNQMAAQDSQLDRLTTDAALTGDNQRADLLLKDRFALLDRLAKEKQWPPELLAEKKELARMQLKAGQLSYDGRAAATDGKSEEYIANLRKKGIEGFSPTRQDEIISDVQKNVHQYESALKGQQYIKYAEYSAKIDNGTFTQADMDMAQSEVGGHHFAQLNSQYQKYAQQIEESNAITSRMRDDYGNPTEIGKYSGKEIDNAYKNEIRIAEQSFGLEPGTLPLKERVSIAAQIKAPNAVISKQLSNGIKYGDVNAAEAALNLQRRNPISIDGMDEKSKDILSLYDDNVVSGIPKDLAMQSAINDISKVDEHMMEENDKAFAEKVTSKKYNETNYKKKFVAQAMDIDRGIIPAGFSNQFMDTFKRNHRRLGNWDAALKKTKELYERTYGITKVNGKNEFTYAPIEKFVPGGNEAMPLIRKEAANKILELGTKQRELFDSGNSDFYYEVVFEKAGYATEELTIGDPNKFKITKHTRSGKEEGTLVIQADKNSLVPYYGEAPSYFLGVQFKDKPLESMVDPTKGWQENQIRFKPDTKEFLREAEEVRKRKFQERVKQEPMRKKIEQSRMVERLLGDE